MKIIVPMIIGIVIGIYISVPFPALLIIGGFIFLSLAISAFTPLSPKQRSLVAPLPYLFFLLVGLVCIEHSEKKNVVDAGLINTKQSLLVEVVSIPKFGQRIGFEGVIKGYQQEEQTITGSFGKLYLSLEKKENHSAPKKGDVLMIRTKINALQAPKNPYAFDFKNFLQKKGIQHSGFVNNDSWKIIRSNNTFSILASAQSIQQKLTHVFNQYIPQDREAAVVNALILGNKSALNPEIRDAYADTGALHVLAVSGLHVGLIYGFLVWLMNKMGRLNPGTGSNSLLSKKAIKFIIPFLGIWAFTFIAGASPSVVRASLMLSLLLISNLLQRYPSIYNTMAFAAFIMLLLNPWQLFNVSFQLSFLALLGIIFFQPKIYKFWYIENWLGDKIWVLVSVGIAAQLGTFPIAIYYFHQFPLYFWLSGIIVVPAAMLILGLGLILLFTHFTFAFLAPFVAKALTAVVWIMNALIYLIQQIPFATYNGIWIPPRLVMLLYLLLLIFAFSLVYQKKQLLYAALFGTLMLSVAHFAKITCSTPVHKLIVYHSYGQSRIDYLVGSTNYAFTSPDFDPDKLNQLVTPVHKAHLINKTYSELPNKFLHPKIKGVEFYSLDDKKMAILSHDINLYEIDHLQVDYLIITGNPKAKVDLILDKFNANNIILDSSNSPWFIKNIQEAIDRKKYSTSTFVVPKDGAFIIDFEKDNHYHLGGNNKKL